MGQWIDSHRDEESRRHLVIVTRFVCVMAFLSMLVADLQGQEQIVLSRDGATVMLEPYAPNIVRVTLSLRKLMRWLRLDTASLHMPLLMTG